MTKKIIAAFLLIFILAGCGQVTETDQENSDDGGEVIFCTEDAKVCPDGSAVGRIPPDCEFAPCSSNAFMPSQTISVEELPIYDCGLYSDNQRRCPIAGDIVAKISTDFGDIWIKFFPNATPKTFENFVGLSERGFYDSLIFHRVIPDFMIQGGDPNGDGTGGESIWGGEFEDEITALSNIRGAVAMANRGADTNTSQFFINQADNLFLDGGYTVFGQVFSGMSAVDEIIVVERDGNDKPLEDIPMQVEVYEVTE